MNSRSKVAALILFLIVLSLQSASAATKNDAKLFQRLNKNGLIYFKRKQFKKAIDSFEKAVKIQPADASVHYYLGLSAFYDKNYDLAIKELGRVAVMTPAASTFHKNAVKCFSDYKKELKGLKAYSCVNASGNYFYWTKAKQPVKIYISHGLKLPKGLRDKQLTPTELHNLSGWLKSKKFVSGIRRDSHYVDSLWQAARDGVSEWGSALSQKIVDYKLVKDPYNADILFFWCSELPANLSARTNMPLKEGDRVIIQIAVEKIMQMQAHLRHDTLRYTAAHEFGHALGLSNSPFQRDIMYPIEKTKRHKVGFLPGGANKVSQNDIFCLRSLYSLPPISLPK